MASANWPAVASDDIVLAVNEAVANVIDHAYLDDAPSDTPLMIRRQGGVDAAGGMAGGR